MSFAGSFKSMIGGDTICDHFNVSTKSYCKRLKVICAEHAKDPKVIIYSFDPGLLLFSSVSFM